MHISTTLRILRMLNLSNLRTVQKNIFFSYIVTIGLLISSGFTTPSFGNSSTFSYKIGSSLRFDFKGCSKSNNDVVCIGNIRSQNGEQKISIGPGWESNNYITITNSNGKVYMADEVKVGNNWTCRAGSGCEGNGGWLPGVGEFTFVEGINYETSFFFRNVSLPSPNIPLLYFSTDGIFSNSPIRIRNIKITDPTTNILPQNPRNRMRSRNTPVQQNSLSYKLSDALHFSFKGCSRFVDTNDVVCIGNFRSLNGEQRISIGSGDSTSITDTKGTVHNANEIKIGDAFSCRDTRCEIDLVEGIDYKTSFVFKNVSLDVPQISLFYFQSTSEFVGTRFQIKARNIRVAERQITS